MTDRTYIAIDLKSFYASVECIDRQLDPMTTNLVVADKSRTEKTICLAVSPSLKAHGIPGRARLFEVIQRVRAVNADRRQKAPGRQFTGKSFNAPELQANPLLELVRIDLSETHILNAEVAEMRQALSPSADTSAGDGGGCRDRASAQSQL